MSRAELKAEYQTYAIDRLLELKARRPELSSEAREAIDDVLASRPEYDPGIVEQWERRGDAYRHTTRWIRIVVLLVLLPALPAALLLLPEPFASQAVVGLLLVVSALVLLDAWYARRMLACPNCERFPLPEWMVRGVVTRWYLAELRCAFCGKFLGPGGLANSFKRPFRRIA